MTNLSQETWIYLHTLVRFFCRRRSINKITFAKAVGKQHALLSRALESGEPDDEAMRERDRHYANVEEVVWKQVNGFLTKGTLVHVRQYQKAFDQVARNYFDAVTTIDGFDLARIHANLMLDQGVKGDETCRSFFEQYGEEPDLLPTLKKRLQSLHPDHEHIQNSPTSFKNAIGKIFNIAAIEFDTSGYPIAPYDKRLDNRHFLLVRRSSQNDGTFITHGLKFARHDRNRDFMYFSEQYNSKRNGQRHARAGRESRGICFFDGAYVKGLARPSTGHTLSYLVGRLPVDDDFDVFPALLTTSNSAEIRIAAKSIVLAVDSADFKHAHTGVFDDHEIKTLFTGDQLDALTDWLYAEGKTPPFTL